MVDSKNCTGCSACMAVCPTKAIQMEPDSEGFLCPHISSEMCINCGKCEKICPVQNSVGVPDRKEAYMAYALDDIIRKNSSSGGMFSVFAQMIIEEGGVVFGAALTEDCQKVQHIKVESIPQLENLRGSKYLASDLGETYQDAKNALKEGRRVLFSGTPCQIAGLKAYLGEDNERLLTVDFICHGVPSPYVWKCYVGDMEQKIGAPVKQVRFRDKLHGWKKFSLSMDFENGLNITEKVEDNLYLKGFIHNLFLRQSCYQCKFKNDQYQSDITLADFWGVQRMFPELDMTAGISLVIIHTEKGQKYLHECQDRAQVTQADFEPALRSNQPYFKSVEKKKIREIVFRHIEKSGALKTLKKYCGTSLMAKVRRKIYM